MSASLFFLLRTTRDASVSGDYQATNVSQGEFQELLGDVLTVTRNDVAGINREIGGIIHIIGDSVNELQGSFTQLGEQTQHQETAIHQVISSLSDLNSEEQTTQVGYEEFARETEAVLQYMVDHVIHISKESMHMANTIDDIVEDMDKVVSLLGDEVRNLSRNSNKFSDQIREVVGMARENIEQAKVTVSNMASKDLNVAIHSREKVEIMLQQVSQLSERVGRYLENINSSTDSINYNVSVAVRSLQFEDITSQMAMKIQARIDSLVESLDRVSDIVRQQDVFSNPDQATLHSPTMLKTSCGDKQGHHVKKPDAVPMPGMGMGEVELF